MKKIIIFILMFFTIPTISVFAVMETITYDVTVYEDKGYNLITGQFEDMPSYASTNRLLVNSVEIDFVADTFHHVLYWDNNNKYIGYSNSQYSNLELSTYITAAINNYITMPPNTKFVAFMVYTQVDQLFPQLSYQTLSDTFTTYSNLTHLTNTTVKSVGKNLFDLSSFIANGSAYYSGTTDGLYVNATDGRGGNDSLLWVRLKKSTSYTIKLTQSTGIRVYEQGVIGALFAFTDSTLTFSTNATNEYYGFKFVETTNMPKLLSSIQLEQGTVATTYAPYWAIIEDLDTTDYYYQNNSYPYIAWVENGTSLTISQMDEYYQMYDEVYNNYPYALSATSLTLMQPITYQRDEVTPLPVEEIDTKIENYLTDLNVNTPFAKTLLAISMIIIVMVALALIKTPKYIFIGAGIMVYIFFTLLGWFPIWILVLLGILVIGMLIMSFRGSGGGSDD